MGIVRLITVAAIIWLVWFFFKRFQQNMLERKKTSEHQNKKKTDTVSNVRKCAVCGIHVPESEAIAHNGRYYCSTAHKDSE